MKFKPTINLVLFYILIALPFGIWSITATGSTPFLDQLITFLFGFSNGLLFAFICIIISTISKNAFLGITYFLNILSYTIALSTVFYYLSFGFPFSSSSLIVLLETNGQEAQEFITSFSNLGIISFLLCYALLQIFIFICNGKLSELVYTVRWKIRFAFQLAILIIYSACIWRNDLLFQDNMFYALRDTYKHYKEEKYLISKLRSDIITGELNMKISRPEFEENETYILVLGESLSRHHMSLYGYSRKTNPELEKLKDELLIFKDVISSDNTTVNCLKKILTFANIESMEALHTKPGLLQVLNKLGFHTYWISNQNYSGTHDSWATIFSQDAKEKFYTNFVNGIKSTPVYDEAVLNPFKKILESTEHKKFIIIHLIGSHKRADFRYPISFNKFTSFSDQPLTNKNAGSVEKNYVNYYDNSVLYNDFIISEIIHLTKDLNQKSFVLYFPDHGEEVCEQSNFSGHANGVDSRFMVEIPMILWRSAGFKNRRFIDESVIKRSYQTDDVIHSVLDLLEVQCSDFIEKKSIFNPSYQAEKRIVEGRYDYDLLFGNCN